jgi:predicted nucleic acid-binding protein
MARHLLDTDVLIWVLRGKTQAVSFLQNLLRNEIPAISTLSLYEIWAGARPQEESAIASFLEAFHLVPVHSSIAKQGSEYYRKFRTKGMTLSSTDALIAASAFIEGLILVTQNRRHFPMTDIELRSL